MQLTDAKLVLTHTKFLYISIMDDSLLEIKPDKR